MVTWVEIFLIVYQQFVTVWNNRKSPCNSNSLVGSISPFCFICHCWNPSYHSPLPPPTPATFPQQRHKTDNKQHQIFLPLRLLDACVALNKQKENIAGQKVTESIPTPGDSCLQWLHTGIHSFIQTTNV